MKAEKLASILTKRYPGREVLVYDTETDEFFDLEPEDLTPGFADKADTLGAHDVVLYDETEEEDNEGLSKVVILWKS